MKHNNLLAIIRDFIKLMTNINGRFDGEYRKGYNQALKDLGAYITGIESVTGKGEK